MNGGIMMRHRIKICLFLLPVTFTMASCATISKDSCRNDSWYGVGFKGGIENHDRADHISDVDKICGKLGITVDLPEYEQGFAAGTERFCEPGNGYQWGLKGRSYNGICANSEFSAAYADGYRIYQVEQRRSAIQSRLSTIRDRLAKLSVQLDEDKALTDEERRKLLRQYDDLLLERSDLLAEQRSLPPT
jgi:hypothetical protein